jgi:hypothetical protein
MSLAHRYVEHLLDGRVAFACTQRDVDAEVVLCREAD